MLDTVTAARVCEGCDRPLEETSLRLVYTTPAGERRAHECDCGALTVTVARSD